MENETKSSERPVDRSADRRKEPRYPLVAKVIVRTKSGEAIHATAIDISGSGMKLTLEQPSLLAIDDEVTVEVELPDRPEKPFSVWGLGRVAYIDDAGAGIQLHGGQFDSLPSSCRES
jgi:hypothetical protein